MDWPAVLPLPINDSFNRQVRTKMRRTKMDDGSSRGRRMFANHAYNTRLTFRFTNNQMAIFDAFIKYDCNYGTLWFNLQIRKDKGKVAVKLTGDAPSVKPLGLDWEVSFDIMTMNDLTFATPTSPNLSTIVPWPSALPLPMKDSYSTQVSNLFIEDDMTDGGMPNSRSRNTYKETVIQVTWLLSASERDEFFRFFKYDLLDGYLPFMMAIYNGRGMTQAKHKFQEFPTETSQGAAFQISAKLSTFNAPVMSLAEYRLQVPVA